MKYSNDKNKKSLKRIKHSLNFFILIIMLSNINNINSIIYLPFETKTKDFSTDNFFSKYLSTYFEMGTPPQFIEAELDFQEMDFHLSYTRRYITFSYNKSLSSTYVNTTNYHISTNNFLSGCRANETFYFYSNEKFSKKTEYKNIPFFMSTSSNQKFGAVLAFAISYKGLRNFVYSLKYGKAINSYTWTLQFNDINSGLLIIGDEPHMYNDSYYDGNKLKYTKIYKDRNLLFSWCFELNKIKIGDDVVDLNINDKNVFLNIIRPEIGGMVAPWEYYLELKNIFFEKYFENNICKEISFLEKNISNNDFYNAEKLEFYKIECTKNKFGINDIKNLPKIQFENIPINYSFIFTGDDLFLEENDNKYTFQIYFANVSYWYIGRLFLYKYQLIFNEDNKLIGFYTGKKEINISRINTAFKVCLIIIIALFCLFLSFVFYKKLKMTLLKKTKKNARELEEDFSYKKSDSDDDDANNDNLLFNKNE